MKNSKRHTVTLTVDFNYPAINRAEALRIARKLYLEKYWYAEQFDEPPIQTHVTGVKLAPITPTAYLVKCPDDYNPIFKNHKLALEVAEREGGKIVLLYTR